MLAGLIGLVIGIIVGLLGAGGGILSIPILVYLLHQEPHAASAESLVIVGLTALVSLLGRFREVHWRDGFIFGVLSLVGSFIGSKLNALASGDLFMYLFALLLIVVAVIMVRRGIRDKHAEDTATSSTQARNPRPLWMVALAATLTGLLVGFFGVGGGFAVVPMLVLIMGFSMKDASATSLLVMIISSVAGLVSRIGTDINANWTLVLIFAVASMLGGMIGAPASKRFRSSTLTLIFGALLAAVALMTGVETLLGQ